MNKAIQKGFKTCGICQGEYQFFQMTPVYLRDRDSNGDEYFEEFFRSAFYIGVLSLLSESALKGGLWWLVLCTIKFVGQQCRQMRSVV